MSDLNRFGISLPTHLLEIFDQSITNKGYQNRSQAIRDLITKEIVKDEWQDNNSDEVAGAITLVYDHHSKGLSDNLTSLQHDFYDIIISTTHVHLDHDNCLEVIIVKGPTHKVKEIVEKLKVIRGIKHNEIAMTTTGKNLD